MSQATKDKIIYNNKYSAIAIVIETMRELSYYTPWLYNYKVLKLTLDSIEQRFNHNIKCNWSGSEVLSRNVY